MKLILKDITATKLMQGFDMFEPFKFVGKIMDAPGTLTKPIGETLRALYNGSKDDPFVVVGLIQNAKAAFIENHKVYSDGEQWCTVGELCRHYDARDMIVVPEGATADA